MADIQKLTVNNTEYTLKDAEARSSLANKAPLASPAFTGTPTAPTAEAGTNTTQIATTEFVMNAFSANDAMVFKGTIGNSVEDTVSALPDRHNKGWTYRVNTAGTYAGHTCEVGDLLICITNGTSANDAHWAVAQGNIDGAVTGPVSSTADHVATFSGTNGKVIKDSGFTIAKNVPSDAVFTDTTYESKSASQNGTDVSLVTTGEKYTWNSKTDNVGTVTGVKMNNGSAISPDANGVVDLGIVKTVNELPAVTSSDNGKVLTVSSGAWSAQTASGGGASVDTLSITLASGSWSSATPPTQTVTATGVTANSTVIVGLADNATTDQLEAARDGGVRGTAQAANSLTFTAYGDEPTENIPVSVVILG